MATVKIVDKLSGEVLEQYESAHNLKEWIVQNVPNYKETVNPPYSATLNGRQWPHARHNRTLLDSDEVIITLEPQNPAVAYWVIAIASAAYSYYVASNLPDYQNSALEGKSIYAPDARANSISPSGVIREIAGSIQIFPDVLSLYRRYESEKEYLYMLLSIGRGYFSVDESNVYIANTPLINYDGDTSVEIFEPAATVTANVGSENWYTTPEVDGQDLSITNNTSIISGNGWTFDFSGSTVTSYFNATATEFPFDVGDVLSIYSAALNRGVSCIVDSISGSSNEIATCNEIEVINTPSGGFNYLQFVEGGAITFATETGVDAGISQWRSLKLFGPYRASPEGETARYFELDIFFPGGLASFTASGSPVDRTAAVDIQYRLVGSSAWTTNDIADSTYTAATTDQFGYTVEIDTGAAGEYEFRFSTGAITGGGAKYVENQQIKRLKAKLTAPSSYSDITTAALKIEGNSSFSKSAENKINIRGATRKLPTIAELESGTWDLTDSATLVAGEYLAIQGALIESTSYTDVGVYPELTTPTVFHSEMSEDGLHLIVTDNDAIKFFTLDNQFRPDLGFTYDGYYDAQRLMSKIRDSGDNLYTYDDDGGGNARILQRLLSTPYDPTVTASVGSFITSTEITNHSSFDVSLDESTFWISDPDTQTIHQYSMSTPGNIGTASYDSISFDASAILGDNSGDSTKDLKSISFAQYAFGTDYTKLLLLRRDGVIFPCTMSTPGDITTATYDGSPISYGLGGTAEHVQLDAYYYYFSSISSSVGFVSTFSIPSISSDSRASRSAMRFIGLVLREALGDDAATMVDWDVMGTVDTLLASRGDYLDADFADESTLWDAIKVMCGAVMCEPTIKEGKFLPKRLTDGLTQSHLYTPDIMLNDGLQIDHEFYDSQEPDGVDVEYFSTTTNSMEVVECRLAGDTGLRPKRLQIIGVTDETRAWRIGMRERYRIFYKPATYTFTTEMDALNSEYGDIIAIASDVFSSQYGEVTSVSGSNVTLDFEPDFSAGGTHYAAFRDGEGAFSGLYTVVAGPSSNQITLSSPSTLDFTPVTDGSQDPSFMSFGPDNIWGKNAIIRKIAPNDENSVTVTAEEYIEEIYQDDDNSPS